MIDWMHDLGKDWGRWNRKCPDWPYRSLAGVVAEYGSVGAAIKSYVQAIPIRDMPIDILEFHNAWQVSKPRTKGTIYVFYYLLGDVESKAKSLGIAKRTLYERVTTAQTELWSLMDLQSRVRKVREVQGVQLVT